MADNDFMKLRAINVNEHVEKKKTGEKNTDGTDKTLTYLSWAWAWDEFKQVYPDADYRIYKDEFGRPYVYDPALGYMVYTTVTAGGRTYEMWLPVMDSKNKAMKAEPYQYATKYGPKTVEPATMFDINKTIMRCLVKNLAMFGLGLYIYAGEDLPEDADEEPKQTAKKAEKAPEPKAEETKPQWAQFWESLQKKFTDMEKLKAVLKQCGASKPSDINAFVYGQAEKMLNDSENAPV